MSSQYYLIFAEIEFWRDTLRNSKSKVSARELESIHQSLILAQNKLIALDMTMPANGMQDGISVAYH
ncbi:MAG: hypothetical protein L3J22_05450 [Xanthomonadales bacterium]|nr:hypothetical protein [Xanthomonadales bacterium]